VGGAVASVFWANDALECPAQQRQWAEEDRKRWIHSTPAAPPIPPTVVQGTPANAPPTPTVLITPAAPPAPSTNVHPHVLPHVPQVTVVFNRPPRDARDPNGARAPGKPGEAEGFRDPRTGEAWVKTEGGKAGWLDDKGNVWVPTGPGSLAHGGAHWDVQHPNGGYKNVYPGGRVRAGQ
jgi:hypothetical protein